ncbi:MAG: DUF86 domain-containing protein [Chloroflexi bacterium]|nr:DUF86 domain-containing protein [Chloroflexota bacterium]
MSKHDVPLRLRHMLDHAREACAIAKGRTVSDMGTDRILNLALTRLLEIIGEAASQVPRIDQSHYPQIPWAQIVSLRNRLIHGYDSVDSDIMWQIVTHDLPPLIDELENILLSGEEKP